MIPRRGGAQLFHVIGDYARPTVRLPGSGGAPDIAACAREVLIIMKQSPRSFVARLDFMTSCGYLGGTGERRRAGFPGAGPRAVITDFGILRPDAVTEELVTPPGQQKKKKK